MPRLYLIRHAEPAATWSSPLYPDPGLTPLGLAQAADAAMKLAALKPKHLATSPMLRCRETAAALEMELGVTAQIDEAISEVRAPEDVPDRTAWLKQTFAGISPADQNRTKWSDAGAALQEWRAALIGHIARAEEDSAIFTHFIALNAIASAALGVEDTIVFRPAHASITTLDADASRMRIVALGAETAAVTVL